MNIDNYSLFRRKSTSLFDIALLKDGSHITAYLLCNDPWEIISVWPMTSWNYFENQRYYSETADGVWTILSKKKKKKKEKYKKNIANSKSRKFKFANELPEKTLMSADIFLQKHAIYYSHDALSNSSSNPLLKLTFHNSLKLNVEMKKNIDSIRGKQATSRCCFLNLLPMKFRHFDLTERSEYRNWLSVKVEDTLC